MAGNEVRIRITAEDHASAPIASVKASTIAAGAAMGSILANLGRDLAGMAKETVTAFADVGSQIFDMSQKTGIGAEALSELKFAAEQSGSSMDAIGLAAKRMNTQLSELSSGSASAKEAFAALGLGLNEFLGKGPEENFDLVLAKLAEVGDKSAQSAIAVALFGKSGTDLLPMLADGSVGLDEMRQQAHALGITLTDLEAALADRLGDSLGGLQARMRGVSLELGKALAPAMIGLATVAVNAINAIRGNQTALAALAGVIGGGLIAVVIAFVSAIGAIPIAIGAVVAVVAGAVALIVSHFDEIQEAWNHLWDAMPGPIKTVWEGIKSFLGMLTAEFRNSINFVIDMLNKIQLPDWDFLGPLAGKGINIPHIEDMAAAVGDLVMAGVGKAKGFVSGLGAALPGLGDRPRETGLVDQVDSTTRATKELTEAEKALEEQRRALRETIQDIQTTFLDQQVEAYWEGGMASVEAIKATQALQNDELKSQAAKLMELFGISLPEALDRSFEHIIEGAKKAEEAAAKLRDSMFDMAKQFLNVKIAPGAQAAISGFFGQAGAQATFGPGGEFGFTGAPAPASNFGSLAELAEMTGLPTFASGGRVPGTGPQLAVVHGGETVVPAGSGMVLNLTINAGIGADGAALGKTVVEWINKYTLQGGAGILRGAVQP